MILIAGAGGAGPITTSCDNPEVQPVEFVTLKLYLPETNPEIVAFDPSPARSVPPGVRVIRHVPAGRPLNITLPGVTQVGCVIVPAWGAEGFSFTVSVYVSLAVAQCLRKGLLVVIVIITLRPASSASGVYVKLNGDDPAEDGVSEPLPFSVNVTLVAIPSKVLSPTVTEVVPHVLPLVLFKVSVGHCPDVIIGINKRRLTK